MNVLSKRIYSSCSVRLRATTESCSILSLPSHQNRASSSSHPDIFTKALQEKTEQELEEMTRSGGIRVSAFASQETSTVGLSVHNNTVLIVIIL